MAIFYKGSLKDVPSKDEETVEKFILGKQNLTLGSYNKESGVYLTQLSAITGNTIEDMYFCTSLSSQKIKNITENKNVELNAFDDNAFVTLTGIASVITNPSIIQNKWQPWMLTTFPDGPTSKDFCLLHVTNTNARIGIF